MDLSDFQTLLSDMIEGVEAVDTVTAPASSLTDSRFIGVTLQDGHQFSIHIQETE